MNRWIGAALGDYELEEKIEEGAFAAVYRGMNRRTGEARAFKVARQSGEEVERGRPEWSTEALLDATGAILAAEVDTNALLRLQFEALQSGGVPYPRVDALFESNGTAVIQMELLEGRNLREAIEHNEVSAEMLLHLGRALVELERSGRRHGDLKPENIFIVSGRVILLDPGFYGEIALANGSRARVEVMTPAYYSFRWPDDMAAMGLILLEIVAGLNPLRLGGRMERGLLAPEMIRRLVEQHRGNNYFFDEICALSARTAIGEKLAASPLGPVICQSLGVQFGLRLGEGPRYPDVAALEAALGRALAGVKKEPAEIPTPLKCFECGKPARGEDRCPYCSVSRLAPACPSCGEPVSRARNQDVSSYCFPAWTGIYDQYAWNAGWDGRCAGCGFEFAARVQIRTGHDTWISLPDAEFETENYRNGLSVVRVCGAESVHRDSDFWDHVPVIEVQVRRAEASGSEKALPRDSAIMMTLEEWRTVFEQLYGPLRPLLDRRGWMRDKT